MKTFHHDKGTALLELVMAMAFLSFILITTFFFGWAMMNQQHVKSSARYASWREVYNVGIVHNVDDPYNPNGHLSAIEASDPNDLTPITDDSLNSLFFRNEGTGIGFGYYDGDDTEFDQWVQAAQGKSNSAGDFVNALLLDPPAGYGTFHHATGAEISSSFLTDVEYFKRFSGGIHSHHIRDGIEWRRRQADERHVTRIQFLQSLDDQLKSVQGNGADMAQMIRDLYFHGW